MEDKLEEKGKQLDVKNRQFIVLNMQYQTLLGRDLRQTDVLATKLHKLSEWDEKFKSELNKLIDMNQGMKTQATELDEREKELSLETCKLTELKAELKDSWELFDSEKLRLNFASVNRPKLFPDQVEAMNITINKRFAQVEQELKKQVLELCGKAADKRVEQGCLQRDG